MNNISQIIAAKKAPNLLDVASNAVKDYISNSTPVKGTDGKPIQYSTENQKQHDDLCKESQDKVVAALKDVGIDAAAIITDAKEKRWAHISIAYALDAALQKQLKTNQSSVSRGA